MKKAGLIIGILMLVLAPTARGGLVFTVNGTELADGSTIVLGPSDVIELDLEIAEGHNIFMYDIGYTLTNMGAEFITTGGYGYGPISFPTVFEFPPGIVYVEEPQYIEIYAGNFDFPAWGPSVLMKNLLVHKLNSMPVDLFITNGGTMIDWEMVPDGALLYTLHIVPEPATIFFLVAGGLMLRSHKTKRREYKSNADA